MTTSCGVERGESRSLSLHVVPRNHGLGEIKPAVTPRQHHLLPILYSTVKPSIIGQVEGCCSVPIIHQQFGGAHTVIAPHEQHTPGRGPASVAEYPAP